MRKVDKFFTKEELKTIYHAMYQTWNSIGYDVEQAAEAGDRCKALTTKDIIDTVFDAGYMTVYGNINEELYNRIVLNFFNGLQTWAIKAWDSQGGTI